jgi:hypothetical protein
MRTIILVGSACIAAVTSCDCRCDGRRKAYKRAETKLEELREWRSFHPPDSGQDEYTRTMAERALGLLRSRKVGDDPVPLLASIIRSDKLVSLDMWFFDGTFEADGFLLENSDGYEKKFRTFDWTEAEKAVRANTVIRHIAIPISLDGRTPKLMFPAKCFGPIDVPSSILKSNNRLRLIRKDGNLTDAIEVYVQENLRKGLPNGIASEANRPKR